MEGWASAVVGTVPAGRDLLMWNWLVKQAERTIVGRRMRSRGGFVSWWRALSMCRIKKPHQ